MGSGLPVGSLHIQPIASPFPKHLGVVRCKIRRRMIKMHWAVLPDGLTSDDLGHILFSGVQQYCGGVIDGKLTVDEHVVKALEEVMNPDRSEVDNLKQAIDIIAWRMAIQMGDLPADTPYAKE